jgi:hypothetical protein
MPSPCLCGISTFCENTAHEKTPAEAAGLPTKPVIIADLLSATN